MRALNISIVHHANISCLKNILVKFQLEKKRSENVFDLKKFQFCKIKIPFPFYNIRLSFAI